MQADHHPSMPLPRRNPALAYAASPPATSYLLSSFPAAWRSWGGRCDWKTHRLSSWDLCLCPVSRGLLRTVVGLDPIWLMDQTCVVLGRSAIPPKCVGSPAWSSQLSRCSEEREKVNFGFFLNFRSLLITSFPKFTYSEARSGKAILLRASLSMATRSKQSQLLPLREILPPW